DALGFGNCTNHRSCEATCPKEVSIVNIARLNREFLKAGLASDATPDLAGDSGAEDDRSEKTKEIPKASKPQAKSTTEGMVLTGAIYILTFVFVLASLWQAFAGIL
nr:hypothetical protein [Desulfobacterales bacterium]